jgi:hypothetical protein
MLLALDDDNGHVVSSSSMALPYAISGAVLFELSRHGHATISGKTLTHAPKAPVGDAVLDMAIARFAKQEKQKPVKYWVQQIARDYKTIKELIIEKLIHIGAIRRDQRTFLWIIPYQRFPTDDSTIENKLRKRLHEWVLGRTSIDEEGYILLSLIGAANLEKEVFEKDAVRTAKQRIKQILREEEIGAAVSEVVQCIQAAIIASVVASSAAASAASS